MKRIQAAVWCAIVASLLGFVAMCAGCADGRVAPKTEEGKRIVYAECLASRESYNLACRVIAEDMTRANLYYDYPLIPGDVVYSRAWERP